MIFIYQKQYSGSARLWPHLKDLGTALYVRDEMEWCNIDHLTPVSENEDLYTMSQLTASIFTQSLYVVHAQLKLSTTHAVTFLQCVSVMVAVV